MIKKLTFVVALIVGVILTARSVDAALLENASVSVSNPSFSATNVTYTIRFTGIASDFDSAQFRFCDNPSGACTDTTIDGTGTDLILATEAGDNVVTNWTESWVGATTYALRITEAVDDGDTDAAPYVLSFDSIDNPGSNTECNPAAGNSTITCYVRMNTYSDTAWTTIQDEAIVSVTFTTAVTVSARVDPSFTLVIAGIDPALTASANGTTLTSTVTPSISTIPFGNLTPGTEKFAAHSLTVTTNTPKGYSVSVRMDNNLSGSAYAGTISPFIGNSANFTTAAAWTVPTGTVNGTNTGWLGVGTDDTQVTGQLANAFFSLGTTATTIANHTTSASAEEDLIVYGIEVNAFQQADAYTGTMRYNALPVY